MTRDGHGIRPPRDEAERVERSEMADALREYQSQNRELKTLQQLSSKVGVNPDTLSRLLHGTGTPGEKSRRKLYEATKAEPFRKRLAPSSVRRRRSPLANQPSSKVEDLVDEVRRLSSKVERLSRFLAPEPSRQISASAHGEQVSTRARARAIAVTLGELDRQLAFFKEESRQDARQVLRGVVNAKDVGYLIALLKAMYDDDAFENWVFGAQYDASNK